MGRHPRSALAFVWACDLLGLIVVATAFREFNPSAYHAAIWVEFVLWAVLLCVAHLGGVEFFGLNIHSGWSVAIDFAAALVLPFPLFCLIVMAWLAITVGKRIREKHPEPFLGPDFNAMNVILDATAAKLVYAWLVHLTADYPFGSTVALMAAAVTFVAVQNLLLATLLSLDMRKAWRKVGCLEPDTLLSDGMMITAGALVGRVYQFDPFLLLMMLVPLLFMHKMLGRLNEAKLAYFDGKTGLYNYRYFDETLTDSFRKATQTGQPLALIFGDMDHLRDVNNTHGHLVGDQALVAVANAFRTTAGSDAVACRFGGEEFVLLIPGCSKARAADMAERVRIAVAESKVPLENGETLSVTVSLGVAVYPSDAQTMEELVKSADGAVYQAKHAGRNRVCVCRGQQVAPCGTERTAALVRVEGVMR